MLKVVRGILSLTWLAWLVIFGARQGQAQAEREVVVLNVNAAIAPVQADYLERGLDYADSVDAEAVIVRLNTPGGAITVMNRMVTDIRTSRVPVIVYVTPRGAWAGSAGALITLAGGKAAMAPETSIGAASPVGGGGEDLGETMAAKEQEILKATVRSLTTGRPERAVRLAEDMIDDARAVTAEEALEIGLIDYIAFDVDHLLDQLDGQTIQADGETITLRTADAAINEVNYTLIEEVLNTLTDPNLVFLLLAVGVQAILIELSSPGGWVAGFLGAVALLLAVYGLGVLPVNWFGLLFLAIAFVLFILELKTPALGALTAAGAISFIAGGLILFNSTPMPGFGGVSVPLVVGTGIVLAASFFGLVTFALRAQKTPIQTGREVLPGLVGVARTELNPAGMVYAAGELWSAQLAESGEALPAGTRVEIVAVEGLLLKVRKAPN